MKNGETGILPMGMGWQVLTLFSAVYLSTLNPQPLTEISMQEVEKLRCHEEIFVNLQNRIINARDAVVASEGTVAAAIRHRSNKPRRLREIFESVKDLLRKGKGMHNGASLRYYQ